MARKAPFPERTRRRLAIALGRTRRTLPWSAPRRRSVFFHMPKCGGTSLSEAMYATIPLDERIGVLDAVSTRRAAAMRRFGVDDPAICHEDRETGQSVFDLRETLLLQHMAWDTMLIHGHVLWSERAEAHFGDTYAYVTVLRNPVDRTLSNFRMAQRTGLHEGDFDAYLGGPIARRQARVYLRYLAGRNDIPEENASGAVEASKTRLEKFALIGFLDDLPTFVGRYAETFGVRLRMARLNTAPEDRLEVTPSQMSRLEALCAPDIEIYRHALASYQ